MHKRLLIWSTVVLAGGAWVGCDSSPPPNERAPQTRPTTTVQESPPADQPPAEREQPPGDVPEPQPATAQEQPAEPELPKYLKVTSLYDRKQAADVRIRIEPGNRLILDTRNVQRIRIDRSALPLQPDRSIVLRLDGQGIEWRADSQVTEFERSANGDWSPVKPSETRRRR